VHWGAGFRIFGNPHPIEGRAGNLRSLKEKGIAPKIIASELAFLIHPLEGLKGNRGWGTRERGEIKSFVGLQKSPCPFSWGRERENGKGNSRPKRDGGKEGIRACMKNTFSRVMVSGSVKGGTITQRVGESTLILPSIPRSETQEGAARNNRKASYGPPPTSMTNAVAEFLPMQDEWRVDRKREKE